MSRQCDYCDALEKDLARLTKERDEMREIAQEFDDAIEITRLNRIRVDESAMLGAALSRYREWKEKNP